MANMMLGKQEARPNRPRDGRHCDLCGCSQPAVRCDKCGCQIFCLSCDDMYHRHPKRRFHLRKAVDPTPPTSQARPVLPVKIANLPTSPGDPSKMPLPPPRKKKPGKSFFDTFRRRSPSSDQNSPPLPKKEYSWTDRLGNIKKFMSNRPLPPLPDTNGHEESDMHQNSQSMKHDLSFIHKRVEERPPQLPQRSMKPNEFFRDKENLPSRIPGNNAENIRNGTLDPSQMNRRFSGDEENNWDNRTVRNPQINTLNRTNQQGFFPQGGPGYPGNLSSTMHQSGSATDLNNIDAYPGQGMPPPHYPHYPMNPHMPHFPYPMYPPQYPNYPQYFGSSFANLSSQQTTTDGDFSDQSEASSRNQSGRKYPFRKRAKRSQSVMVDRMAFPGQFYPFGPFPPGYGPGPWGPAPYPMEAGPSPSGSVRSLNRIGRTRRRKKMTSDDDEECSMSSSPLSRPKSSSSERPPPAQRIAPLATQTTSEESEEERQNEQSRIRNEKQPYRRDSDPSKQSSRRNSDPRRMPSPLPASPLVHHKKVSKHKQREKVKQSDSEELPPSPAKIDRHHSGDSNTDRKDPDSKSAVWVPTSQWQCNHCTFINPSGNRICQVCCKTASAEMSTLMTSRPNSAAASSGRKQSLSSEQSCSSPEKRMEEDDGVNMKRDNQDMENLNSALDEAEKEISRGLKELMQLKEDFLPPKSPTDTKPVKQTEPPGKAEENAAKSKPVYKSSGKMRTSILDKLNLQPSKQPTKSTASTSTETQTGPSKMDRIIEARRASTSSTTSDAYNSPTAQSPQLERTIKATSRVIGQSSSKRESACQTQTEDLLDYLERKKVEEEGYFGRQNNGHGFRYGERMDAIKSPVPSMYDRGYGGGYGMMQRSHSRASLFTGRLNDLGPMEYGLGPTPMYRSVSRSSLTGDYSENRLSEFHNLRKPDYYLSMEELVERRRQESIRAQGLELVRMIREAEQQGFTADDIQVALSNCGNQSPMEWLQENWRNMVENVISLSTSYANDKKENDIGTVSESEAREALRMHKGNVWASVTECVESRQRKFLELKARGKFSTKDITDALTSNQGDVEMAYAKLTKSTSKPFLMRIWGTGEGVPNQDGAMPLPNEAFKTQRDRYEKENPDMDDVLSDELWDEDYDEEVDWEEDSDEPDEEEQGDLEDLQTCRDDGCISDEIKTPESDKSDYCDAFGSNTLERNVTSPSSDASFVIPDVKQDKKGSGFLSKLAALRKEDRNSKQTRSKFYDSDLDISSLATNKESKEDTIGASSSPSDPSKSNGPLSVIKNTISAIRDSVSGSKSEKKLPCAAPERRTIIVKGQIANESLGNDHSSGVVTLTTVNPLKEDSSIDEIANHKQTVTVSKHSNDTPDSKNVVKDLTKDNPEDNLNKGLTHRTGTIATDSKIKDSMKNPSKEIGVSDSTEKVSDESSKGFELSKLEVIEQKQIKGLPQKDTTSGLPKKQITFRLSPISLSSDKKQELSESKSELNRKDCSNFEVKNGFPPQSFIANDENNTKLENNLNKSSNNPDDSKNQKDLEVLNDNLEKNASTSLSLEKKAILNANHEMDTKHNSEMKRENKEANSKLTLKDNKIKSEQSKPDHKISESNDKVKLEEKNITDNGKFLSNKISDNNIQFDTNSTDLKLGIDNQINGSISSPSTTDIQSTKSDSSEVKKVVPVDASHSNKSQCLPQHIEKSEDEKVHRERLEHVKQNSLTSKDIQNNVSDYLKNSSTENALKITEENLEVSKKEGLSVCTTNKNVSSEQVAQESSSTQEGVLSNLSSLSDSKILATKLDVPEEIRIDRSVLEVPKNAIKINKSKEQSIPRKAEGHLSDQEKKNDSKGTLSDQDNGFTECAPVKAVVKDVSIRSSSESGIKSNSDSSSKTGITNIAESEKTDYLPLLEETASSAEIEVPRKSSSPEGSEIKSITSQSSNNENVLPVSLEGTISTKPKPEAISTALEYNSSTDVQEKDSNVGVTAEDVPIEEDIISLATSNNTAALDFKEFTPKETEPLPEERSVQTVGIVPSSISESTSSNTKNKNDFQESTANTTAKPKLKLVKKSSKKEPELNVKTTHTVLQSTTKNNDALKSGTSTEKNYESTENISEITVEPGETSYKSTDSAEIYPPGLVEVIKRIPVASIESKEQSTPVSVTPVTDGPKVPVAMTPSVEPSPTIPTGLLLGSSASYIENKPTPSVVGDQEKSPLSVEPVRQNSKASTDLCVSNSQVLSETIQQGQEPSEKQDTASYVPTSVENTSPTDDVKSTIEGDKSLSTEAQEELSATGSTFQSSSKPTLHSNATKPSEPSSSPIASEQQLHSKDDINEGSESVTDSIQSSSVSSDSYVITEQTENASIPSENNFSQADKETNELEDDDEESSDESRGNSMSPLSPVDALRHRFEELVDASTSSVIGGIRPQSPYRRMSFRSRKAAIALERTRDTSVEKPWFLPKPSPEPKKTIPKRSLKQQLELERRVRKMVADKKCRTYRKAEIIVQLVDMNFEEEEAIQAANDCSTLEQAISYLQQECLLCTGNFPVSHIISMVHCPHKACRECLRAYFTVQIRDRNIMELLCPFCNEPDIFDEDIAQDYFNHLDIMLKKLVDSEIYELFQRKLRDRVLMRDPNFKWCSQCSSGFIAMPNLKRLVCPDCNAVTCASCRRPWEREHQGISCEAFAAWKDASDPEAQTVGLAKLLTEDGIDCPRCHFRYALAKGGCMHFRCTQCQHDFCSGCSKPFKMGQKCGVSEFCGKLGLHAHHPRNCLFYLRDKDPEDLQRLLDLSEVKYDRDPPDGIDAKSMCQVMEQKETADGMLDDYCGKEVEDGYAGLCRLHYVEYLGQLVNKHKVDPIQIFENDDLELVLRRANIRLPPKRYRETDAQYREKLVNLIQEELPLDKVDDS